MRSGTATTSRAQRRSLSIRHGHRSHLRGRHRDHSPTRHGRGPAPDGSRRAARCCWPRPSTGIADGALVAQPQPAEGISYAPKIVVDDARINWHDPAPAVDRLVRATDPAPGAWTEFRGERLKLGRVTTVDVDELEPGVAGWTSIGCWSVRPPPRLSSARSNREQAGDVGSGLGQESGRKPPSGSDDSPASRRQPCQQAA